MALAGMFNTVQLIGSQMGFIPRPLVANTIFMPTNVSNSFAATYPWGANRYK